MKNKVRSEAEIRDYLAAHLDLIEPGLTLVKKEQYLRNDRGASGFIDIFARSSTGQLVIIEIKRSDAAAREAIQELFKYVALLRETLLVKKTEYRLLIASTEWHELLIPYSELACSAPYDITAKRILLGNDGLPLRTEPVNPVMVAAPRNIARRHFIWHFSSEFKAKSAIPLIAAHMRKAGLEDFVLVLVRLADPTIKEKAYLYFGQQQLTLEAYTALIRRQYDDEQMTDFQEQLRDLSEEEDQIGEAADEVWVTGSDALYDQIEADSCEIAYPEKAQAWFTEGAYIKAEVHRFGRFVDEAIPSKHILDDLIGYGGESDFLVNLTARVDSRAQMDALVAAADNVFFFNPIWRAAVRDLCVYAQKNVAWTVHLQAFCNEDILLGLAGMAFGYPAYISTFRFDIVGPERAECFVGVIEWDGSTPSFDAIVAEHFSGDRFNYFLMRHFGENRSVNGAIMADLGLIYALWRDGEHGPERVRVQGASVVTLHKPQPRSVTAFIEANIDEMHKVVAMFMEIDMGFASAIRNHLDSEFTQAESQLAKIKEHTKPLKEFYWAQPLKTCDLCARPFATARFMVDAHLKRGVGANVCALCFLEHGTGLGTGRGQLYEATAEGWRHVAG